MIYFSLKEVLISLISSAGLGVVFAVIAPLIYELIRLIPDTISVIFLTLKEGIAERPKFECARAIADKKRKTRHIADFLYILSYGFALSLLAYVVYDGVIRIYMLLASFLSSYFVYKKLISKINFKFKLLIKFLLFCIHWFTFIATFPVKLIYFKILKPPVVKLTLALVGKYFANKNEMVMKIKFNDFKKEFSRIDA